MPDYIVNFKINASDIPKEVARAVSQAKAEAEKLSKAAERLNTKYGNPDINTKQGQKVADARAAAREADPTSLRKEIEKEIANLKRFRATAGDLAGLRQAEQQRNRVFQSRVATQSLLEDKNYIDATGKLANIRRQLAAEEKIAAARNVTPATLAAESQVRVQSSIAQAQAQLRDQQRINRLSQAQLGGDVSKGGLAGYAELQGKAIFAEERREAAITAEVEKQKLASTGYIKAVADSTYAERARAALIEKNVQAQVAANPALVNLEARNAVAAATIARQRAAVEADILANSEADLQSIVQQRLADQRLTVAINERLKVAASQAGVGTGTRFQQFQASIASRQGGDLRLPTEFQTLRQFLTSKALTTGGFALSGALFYGAFSGVKQAVTEATQLQTNLTLIKTQLQEMGRSNEFGVLSKSILETARNTGIAGSELAFLALQLRGAFSDAGGGRGGISFITKQLQDFAKIARVTGLPLNEITDSGTAILKTFDTTAKHVGDATLLLQQRFGVLAKETITAAADIAPAAKEAGASFNELAAVVAGIQRSTGRGGEAISEALGRILPAIQDNALPILDAYKQVGDSSEQFANRQQRIITLLGQGKTFDVLKQIMRDFGDIARLQPDAAQAIISALGGRREASTLTALFGESRSILRAINDLNRGEGVGNLDRQFSALQKTITQTFAELKQGALQFGQALLNLGVLDVLQDIGKTLQGIATIFGGLVNRVKDFVNVLQFGGEIPWVTKLLEFFAIYKAFQFFRGGGPGGGAPLAGATNPFLTGQLSGAGVNPKDIPVEARLVNTNQVTRLAAQGKQIGANIVSVTKQGVSGFFNAINEQVKGLSAAGRGALVGGGIAASIIGGEIGGTAGGDISAIGTGATLAGVGIHPVIAVVVAATQIIANHLRAAKEAKEAEEKLLSQYGDIAQTPKGRAQLRDIAGQTQEKNLGGLAGALQQLGVPSGGPREPTTEAKAARKALDEYAFKAIRQRVLALRAVIEDNGKNGYKDQITKTVDFAESQDPAAGARTLRDFFANTKDLIDKGIIVAHGVRKALHGGRKAILDAINEGTRSDVASAGQDELATLQGEYQAGNIGYGTYISKLKEDKAFIQQQLVNAKGGIRKALIKQLVDTDRALSKGISDYVQAQNDVVETLRSIGGKGDDYSETDIQQIAAQLNTPGFNDEGARHAILLKGIAAVRAQLQNEINAQTDDTKKVALALQGRALPEPFKLEALREQVHLALQKAKGVSEQIEKVAAIAGKSAPEIENDIVNVGKFLGVGVRDAALIVFRAMLKDAREKLQALRVSAYLYSLYSSKANEAVRAAIRATKTIIGGNPEGGGTEGLKGVIAALEQSPDLGGLTDPGNVGVDAGSYQAAAENAADDYAKRLALAQAAINSANAARDPVASAYAAIATAQVMIDFAKDEPERLEGIAQLIQAQQQLEAAFREIGTLRNQLQQAQTGGDAVANAMLQIAESYWQMTHAFSEADSLKAAIDLTNAEYALKAAILARYELFNQYNQQATNDPVRKAQLQVEGAYVALLSATNPDDAERAQIEILQAQQALGQAMVDIVTSQIDLAQAIAQAAGDSVAAARDALQKAQYELALAQFSGQGEAKINQLKAQVISAQAALRDATLDEKTSLIDFNLETEKISTAQAISQYEAILASADILGLTEKQRRDLILKIRNLKQSLSQDLQFDLPSELRLPTLYEARRLSQTGGAYQDNRVITVQLNSTDPQSTQNAVNTILDELNSQPVFGTGGRIY